MFPWCVLTSGNKSHILFKCYSGSVFRHESGITFCIRQSIYNLNHEQFSNKGAKIKQCDFSLDQVVVINDAENKRRQTITSSILAYSSWPSPQRQPAWLRPVKPYIPTCRTLPLMQKNMLLSTVEKQIGAVISQNSI